MKINYSLSVLFILLLSFFACNKYEKEDLIGYWEFFPNHSVFPIIESIIFNKDKVEFTDRYLFTQEGTYEVVNDSLIIKTKQNYDIRTLIQNLTSDSLQLFNEEKYYKSENIKKEPYEAYDLIGIQTDRNLANDRIYSIIHFYKNVNDSVKIRFNDKWGSYSDIPYFLERNHYQPDVLLFIGKKITLADLKNIYLQIATNRIKKVILVVNNVGLNEYQVFVDDVPVWWDEVESYVKLVNMPLPPPVVKESRKEYWEKNARRIKMNSLDNLKKLADLNNNQKYIISINKNLPIEVYLKIKEAVFLSQKSKKVDLVTEIV